MVDISTQIQGIMTKLPSCIFNASGARCTSVLELAELSKSESGAILTKSCTLEPRSGNVKPRYYSNTKNDRFFQMQSLETINSTGLANFGYKYYDPKINEELKEILEINNELTATNNQKPYIVSVCGLTLEDNLRILSDLCEKNTSLGISGIELNMSCPNIEGKPQTCYDLDASENLLRKIMDENFLTNMGFGLKLSAYLDTVQLGEMSDLISSMPKINWITCINSLGNGLLITKQDKPAIKPRKGLGGIGGSVIKSIAISNVYQFSQELGSKVDVIGCGGVICGRDVYDHLLVGAKAVQVGSLLQERGSGIFEQLNQELRLIMKDKGYKNLESIQLESYEKN